MPPFRDTRSGSGGQRHYRGGHSSYSTRPFAHPYASRNSIHGVAGGVQRQLDIIANEPSPAVVDEFRRRLNEGNAQGLMLHFDRSQGVMSGWFRPCRVLASGCLTQMGAGGLQGHPDYTPPTCIHALNPLLTNKECEMELHLRKRLPDLPGLHDFFQCPLGHNPRYYMIIPKIQPSIIVHSEEELEQELLGRYMTPGDEDYNMEAEDMRQAMEDARPLSETFDPRVVLLCDVNHPEDETKIIGHYAFYPQAAAVARATNDQALITTILKQQSEGVYRRSFHAHPAYSMSTESHHLLAPYDAHQNPGCEDLPWTFIKNFDTTIGRAIRELNSCGLPATSWHRMQHWTIECKACRQHFSEEGYHDHIHRGFCTNWTAPTPVRPQYIDLNDVEEFHFRTFLQGGSAPQFDEFMDTPVALAMMSWNSRLGVPKDVYTMIFTAATQCDTCRLVRTFRAHLAHLKADGDCGDLGEKGAVIAR